MKINTLSYYFVAILLFVLVPVSNGWAAVIERSGTISAHTTWSNEDVQLITGNVTVSSGIILTIEAGAVVKFNSGRSLTVQGALDAQGTAIDKIHFTSYRDDSLGGDTNGDGNSQAEKGDWGYLYFTSTVTTTLTKLNYLDVRYGGSNNVGNVYIYRTNIAINNSEISHGSSYGVRSYDASPSITNSQINDNNSSGIYLRGTGSPLIQGNGITANTHGVYIYDNTTPTIDNNQITDNTGWGIYYRSSPSAPVITHNTITGNLQNATLPASAVPSSSDNNVLAPNEINGLWIRGGNRLEDLHLALLFSGEAHELNTYQIEGTLTVGSGTTMTVDPGVVVKFNTNSRLDINGTLIADGSEALPIAFTSYRDDTQGGDFNSDGYDSSPANGDWGRITFTSQAVDDASVLDYVTVQYGGSDQGNIYSYKTNLTITNSQIANSKGYGIYSRDANLTLTNNEIFSNGDDGIYYYGTNTSHITGGRIFANFGNGLRAQHSTAVTINDVEIFANVGQGIRSSSSAAIEATGNWWGAVDGASGDEAGSGDQVLSTGSGG
ncbi:MAG: hypothetical protein GQ583_12580, partial [Methyloprofundus sp.]|nr:hypothetical protein [Methyloprofundus sp.]